MKTRDGHKIRLKGTYFCLQYDSFGAPKIIKCECKKVNRERYWRNQFAHMQHCAKDRTPRVYTYSNEGSGITFKSLAKAKTHCLKIMETLREDFETAINNRVNEIKRSRK